MKKRKEKIVDSINLFNELKTNPIDFMNNTTFKRSELDLDARVLNHWYDKKLFPREYVAGSRFVFNLKEAFWIKIIMKLREFNVSLVQLSKIKENLFKEQKKIYSEEDKDEIIKTIKSLGLFEDDVTNKLEDDKKIWDKMFEIKLTDFELIIQSILLERKNFYILLNEKGDVIFGNHEDQKNIKNEDYLKLHKEISTKSHIYLNMTEIFKELVGTLEKTKCTEKIPIFNNEEIETLELLEKINVFTLDYRKKAPHQYESIRVDENNINEIKTMIYELILEKNYQNIVIHPLYGKYHHLEANA
jgi:hypothetical protein